MNSYNVFWQGLDRGHEGTWDPALWRGVLNAFAEYSPVDLKDIDGPFYTILKEKFPDIQWVTSVEGEPPRNFFRDAREAWSSTGVVSFPKGKDCASITMLGKKVMEGSISYADVLSMAAILEEEKNEHPFVILLEALRNSPGGRGLSIKDLIKIMRHYRPGDDINEVLSAADEKLPSTALRRFKAILLLMTYAGLAISKNNLFFAGQDISNYSIITGTDLKDAFVKWLHDENVEGSGRASSYIGALDSADIIARSYCSKFVIPSVYDMPDSSLESLKVFISTEGRKEELVSGSGLFCNLEEVPISHWRDGYCVAAIGALIKFKAIYKKCRGRIIYNRPHSNQDDPPPAVDRLSIALKLFAAKRNEEEWFADNTGGNTNKPRVGYIANKQLRVLSNTPPDIRKLNDDVPTNIRAWFKNYWDANGNKSWIEGLSDADLSGFGPYIAYLLQMGSPSVSKPDKFTNALDAAVKAIIKPEETGFYDERINEILNFLGLIGFEWKEDFDIDDLGEAVNAQRVIKRRLKDLDIKRIQESATSDDGNDPDYITVNEFIWFVKLNLNKIEKEAQEGKMKPAAHKKIGKDQQNKKPQVDLKDFEDVLLLRLRAALRTKPFAILAGHSGTGKSRMVRKLAYMTCNDDALRKDENEKPLKEPGNFCMVQVKPNWHDSSDLLGYYSELGKRYRSTDFVRFICKAYAYPNTPFFVCLDEMNLAPVEQYFAEYLSAIESRKLTKVIIKEENSGADKDEHPLIDKEIEGILTDELLPKSAYTLEDTTGKTINYDWLGCTMTESEHWIKTYGLTIPRNLFVVGTVNMDETTNQFSRKVLDRAMTIEMTDADFDNFGKKSPELNFDDEYMGEEAVKAMLTGEVQAKELSDDQKKNLNSLKEVLAPTSFAVAYRFANEYALYEESLRKTAEVSYKPSGSKEPTEKLELESSASTENATSSEQSSEALATDGGVTEAKTTESAPVKTTPAIPSAFDDMVLMKVLPRISGDENEVQAIFYKGRVQGKEGSRGNPADKTLMKILDVKKDTESLRKIAAILERGGTYLSFWP